MIQFVHNSQAARSDRTLCMITIDRAFDHRRDFQTEDVDKRLAIAVSWSDYDESLRNEMLDMIAEVAQETLPSEIKAHVRGSAYHVGPMAQGPTIQMLFTAYENIMPVATDIAVWIAIGQFARVTMRRTRAILRRFIAEQGAEIEGYRGIYLNDRVVVSQPLIQGLCVEHFSTMYEAAKDRISIDVNARSPYPGIVWAGRPDRSMVYTVRLWAGKTSYVYIIDGEGKPIEHFMTRGVKFAAFPLPDWSESL